MTAGAGRPLLALEGVAYRYRGSAAADPPALAGVSLDVFPGDRVGVVGPNGGGKSTLVKLILGLLRPTAGAVRVCGMPARWSAHLPAVGYVGNPSRNDGESGLPLDLTVGRLLATHADLFRRSGCGYADDGLAARLDLDKPEWRRKLVCELSDGWRQRVLAYLALVKRPRLLVADEATAGLDPEHRAAVLREVGGALAGGTAVVWVTHTYSELLDLRVGRVVKVERGRAAAVAVDGWRCELGVNGGPARRLDLTPDALLESLAQHALDPAVRAVGLTMDRVTGGGGGDGR